MFTGIIQQIGRLRSRAQDGRGATVELSCAFPALEPGESEAVDGVCLTVVRKTPWGFVADASSETLLRTTVAALAQNARVNLERALRLGDRMGGHIVAGHVDGIGIVTERTRVGDAERLQVRAPAEVLRYLAQKGSV